MIFARHLLFAALLTGSLIPIRMVQAQNEPLVTKIVQLNHADARTITLAIQSLPLDVSITMAGDNTLLVTGPAAAVEDTGGLIAQLDIPTSNFEAKLSTVFLPVSTTPSKNLIIMLKKTAASRGSGLAFDAASRMLVVRGTKEEIQAIRELLRQIDRPAQSLTLQFFFIRASIGTGGENKLPSALRRIEKSLAESGFSELSLMAPMTVVTEEDREFDSAARLRNEYGSSPRLEDLLLVVSGVARLQPQSELVQLTIQARISGSYQRGPDSPADAAFEIDTTIAMNLGSYVILAAAPASTASGDAVALVVRVTTGLEPE